MNKTLIIVLTGLLIAGCSSGKAHSSGSQPVASGAKSVSPLENGRDIFQTGRDSSGHPIIATRRPLRSSCAACHQPNGAGGIHVADHAISADLRHKALVTNQKPPYTMQLLERAISSGIDNTGQPLNTVMPRWKMSSRDLHDVAEYVLTLK